MFCFDPARVKCGGIFCGALVVRRYHRGKCRRPQRDGARIITFARAVDDRPELVPEVLVERKRFTADGLVSRRLVEPSGSNTAESLQDSAGVRVRCVGECTADAFFPVRLVGFRRVGELPVFMQTVF